jgi:hypothetical protein
MAGKKTNNMVVEAKAINYARIASPTAKYMTKGTNPLELEWKADLLIDEDTVDAIEKKYPNLRKRMNPITPKKYKSVYKVDMPKDIEGPHILKMTMDVAIEFKDKKTGEKKLLNKPQPKVLLDTGDGKKAKEITFEEYIGNGSEGKVILKHRATSYQGQSIDVLELGSIMLTHLVEVDAKPGQGGDNEDDLEDAFGLEEIEESDAEAPEPNEAGLNGGESLEEQDDDDDDF